MELEQIVVELNGKKIDLSKIGNERVAQVLGTLNEEECYSAEYRDHRDHKDSYHNDTMKNPYKPSYTDHHRDNYSDKHSDKHIEDR